MKVKVIGEIQEKGSEFKVRRMTYKGVIVNYPTGTGLNNYDYKDVELIAEGEIDEFIISNREFLKIKLNRGISVFFYKALKDSLEEEIDEDLGSFNLLRDRYIVNKRGIWNKELICVINDKFPVKVRASGQNFKRDGYSLEVNTIEFNAFLESSEIEINKINKEIKGKEKLLADYKKAINDIGKLDVDTSKQLIQ
ncbi:hypothetical protein [Clostridium vincentii]|uniref:Uncharacterized protein n=1 Tax=Clostridium vincentii TaxID=52704 RepID=A0A2T0BC64_9CLOT|nr:hypothetical protein [Clostridium vincentii]PRR81423.1 hypothetical protein CLVI_25460 [Clostridium vincentii]